MKLIPYLNFNGDCEEAMNFYAAVLSGTYVVDARMNAAAMHLPPHTEGKIMHSVLTFGANTIYAADGAMFEDGDYKGDNRRNILSIMADSVQQGQQLFDSLKDGAKIMINYQKQMWGDHYGQLIDKYGISWAINHQGE